MQTFERVETTVSLPRDLLERANELNTDSEIADVLETALRDLVKRKTREERDKHEIEIINSNAEKLNKEALDVLEYQQVDW